MTLTPEKLTPEKLAVLLDRLENAESYGADEDCARRWCNVIERRHAIDLWSEFREVLEHGRPSPVTT